jgi:signal transduction histidine kinase
MQNVVPVSAIATVSLLVAQLALVLTRTRSCARPSVPLYLAVFLTLFSAQIVLPPGSALQDVVVPAMLWAAGAFLIRSSKRRLFGAWAGAAMALVGTLLLAHALGYESSVPCAAFRFFGIALLAAMPLGISFASWRRNGSPAALSTFIAGAICLCCAGVESIGGFSFPGTPLVADAPALLLSACTGWLVFQEGYPLRTGWRGSLPGLTGKERVLDSLYARLLATENALAGQERIVASGFLALGAAHEFKNTLSLVRLAAHHGLSRIHAAEKDDCLRLIVEQTNTARDSAIDVLDRISSNRGEEACTLDAARDLTGFLRKAGASLRGEGIVIERVLGPGVAFRARRFDVEQIILNLIQNAAESYRRQSDEATRTITILARAEEESAIIEVRDSAGGVSESMRHRIFSPPPASGSGGSGLGLYLSRNLALANGGSLAYQALEGGSAFVLMLPAPQAADAVPLHQPQT